MLNIENRLHTVTVNLKSYLTPFKKKFEESNNNG